VLKNIKRGKYFRLIADVYVDGVNLGEQLVRQGHATRVIQNRLGADFIIVKLNNPR
jgi:endonuclease YncB( thermonuclease family)